MQTFDVRLGIPDDIRERLRGKDWVREGGVLRDARTGRLIAFLPDAERVRLEDLLPPSVVPLLVEGASILALSRRVAALETELRKVSAELERARVGIELANAKLDGQILGSLVACLHACSMDLAEGRTERLPMYRQRLMESFHVLRVAAERAASSTGVLRYHPQTIAIYGRAMVLAGLAARDVSLRISAASTAETAAAALESAGQLHQAVLAAATGLDAGVARILGSASARSFWSDTTHRAVSRELRESVDRLAGHRGQLGQGSLRELARREAVDD